MELRTCSACKRHVKVAARGCPFCGIDLPPGRAQFARPGAFTRAAIFSAAIAGCSDHPHGAATKGSSPTGSAQTGSDDLEQMLDEQPKTADHPMAPADAAQQLDAMEIAATADAGVDPQVVARKKREAALRKLEAQKREREELQRQLDMQNRQHVMAKPYGAPPARRRVV